MGEVSFDPRARSLERALVFNFAIHGIAMAVMASVLLPYMPGGSAVPDGARVARIAAEPWLFRLGWAPWQLCAVADVWLAIALWRASFIARAPALAVLVLTAIAVVPDQLAQGLWITRGIELARAAQNDSGLAQYLDYERWLFNLTAGFGALFYTLAGLAWTACFARARTWTPALTLVSFLLWSMMLAVSLAPLLPPSLRPPSDLIALANAVGFTLLLLWLAMVTEQVLARTRPRLSSGRLAPWRHPRAGVIGRALDALANSRLAAALTEPLPVPAMVSDISEVVYVNYLVPADMLTPWVPAGLELQRLGEGGRWALFTFLTYRHGHFGFRFLGPLRRLMPSPVQTNWRIHVRDPRSQKSGITFVTNAITSTLQALGARLLSEGMPMHVLARGGITRALDGTLEVELDPGAGSAPDAKLELRPAVRPTLEGAWKECFGSFEGFLAYAVPQDRALSTQPYKGRVTRQEITLGIPLDRCEPMTGVVVSRAVRDYVGDAAPLCFRAPGVHFLFAAEAYDRV